MSADNPLWETVAENMNPQGAIHLRGCGVAMVNYVMTTRTMQGFDPISHGLI